MQDPLQIDELIGSVASERFYHAFGGCELYFGNPTVQRLTPFVGLDNAKKLVQLFDGECVYIPKRHQWHAKQQQSQIIQHYQSLKDQGYKAEQATHATAKAFGVSVTWVYQVRKLAKSTPAK